MEHTDKIKKAGEEIVKRFPNMDKIDKPEWEEAFYKLFVEYRSDFKPYILEYKGENLGEEVIDLKAFISDLLEKERAAAVKERMNKGILSGNPSDWLFTLEQIEEEKVNATEAERTRILGLISEMKGKYYGAYEIALNDLEKNI